MKVVVIKRNGEEEEFDPDKIARVVTSAGLQPREGFEMAIDIESWVQSLGQEKIKSAVIRQKVIDELTKVNQFAANAYTWYESTKGKKN